MITFYIFIFSGVALVTLTLTKRIEEKRKKPFFLFKLISNGDENVRKLHHKSLHFYSVGKDKAAFFVKKRLPMHSRNSLNKFITKLGEQTEKYMGDIRDSRLLKKSDGISEFFKNMSTIEKGAGEINDPYESREMEVIQEKIEPIAPVVAAVSAPAKKSHKPEPIHQAKPVLAEVMTAPVPLKRTRKVPAPTSQGLRGASKKVVRLVVREEVEY